MNSKLNPILKGPQSSNRGFTLLELLVVLVIIGLLASFVGPRYFGQLAKSEAKVAKAQLVGLEKALDQYRLDTGRYPGTEAGLAALNDRPQSEPKWDGPYLKGDLPVDPWSRPYIYRVPGEKSEYDLLSLGRDGRQGGTGPDADIAAR
jgi:general secretion pathway protein G